MKQQIYLMAKGNNVVVRADLKSNHLVTKRCPLLPWC